MNESARTADGETEAITQARTRAGAGVAAPSAGLGGLLAWIAATTGAKNAVEVGSAGGVSGLWLVQGLAGRGMLTSVEPDPHHHSLASQAFEEAGSQDRVRTILGEPDAVLERLTDAGYDLVLLQLGASPSSGHLRHADRLLRDGGALVLRTETKADADAAADRLRDDEHFIAVAVLPVDGAVVLATRAHRDGPPTA